MPKTPKQRFLTRLEELKKQAIADEYEGYRNHKKEIDRIKSDIEKSAKLGNDRAVFKHARHADSGFRNSCVRHHFVQLGMTLYFETDEDQNENKLTVSWNTDDEPEDCINWVQLIPDDFVMLHEDEVTA